MPLARQLATALILALLLPSLEYAARADTAVSEAAPARKAGKVSAWMLRMQQKIHLPDRIRRPIEAKLCLVRGTCTLMADRLEHSLPPTLGRLAHKLRLLSPLAAGGFAVSKFKQDPVFLTGFGVASTILQNLEIPAMIALGVNPGVALAIHEIAEPPINLAVIAWRQHHLRKDRSQSFLTTVRGLASEYRDHVESRIEENRAFMKQRQAAPASLKQLGDSLR